MGLVLPQTVKVRTNGSNCKYFREKGYKFEKCGDFIEVDVLDLQKSSNVKVKIKCEICGCESEVLYWYVNKNIDNGTLITCGNKKCKDIKTKKTNNKYYGCDNVFSNQQIKDKIKNTNNKKYGVNNPMESIAIQNKVKATCQKKYGGNSSMCSEEIQNKAKITCQKKYGGNSAMCSEEIQNKAKITCLQHFGVNNPFQSEEVKEKIKVVNLKRYGAENPMQNEEIKNKALDSFQFNGTGPSSRAQRYINYILNGTLNKHICSSLVDIYMEKENIVIEYDGSGHFLNDIINGNAFPTKDSLLREKEREDSIVNKGYKVIRFIATKDRIPSDEVILNLIEGFKNSDFKVIRINFEEGTIDRDYEEKWYCKFGELRKITQKDLEEIESEKTINLK